MFAFGQGAGFGFQMDFGHKNNFQLPAGYDQQMLSFQTGGFVRWFSNGGRHGHQLYTGLRIDSIGFKNHTPYMNQETNTLENYNVDAYLKRVAWRMSYSKHHHFFGRPGSFTMAFNYGLAYEFTSQMKRKSEYDNLEYKLYSEQNRHNLIFTAGIEARFWHFTVGYKIEHMFFDMINHDYLKTQPYHAGNSSELNGVRLSPTMSFFYMAFHFDFFNDDFE
jgi:hypothetical protein